MTGLRERSNGWGVSLPNIPLFFALTSFPPSLKSYGGRQTSVGQAAQSPQAGPRFPSFQYSRSELPATASRSGEAGGAERTDLSFLEIVILKLGQLQDILVLKMKIWIEAYFSGQRGDLREYIDAITVLSLFICFMDDQE